MANTISGITKLNGVPTQARVTLIDVLANTIVGSKLSGGADPYAANVVALLHFDGADGSVIFSDEKTPASGWSASGNAQIDTSASKFGGASGLFDNDGDFLTKTHSVDFSASGVDFTAEAWVRRNASTGIRTIATKRPANGSTSTEWILFTDNGVLRFLAWDAAYAIVASLTGTTVLSQSAFQHVAVSKTGNTWRLFVDGVQEASVAESGTIGTNTSPIYIGRDPTLTTRDWGGWIDELRITRGVGRYTANFTPPTSPFTLGAASGAFSFTGLPAGRYELLTLIPGYKALVDGPWVLDGVAAPVTDDFNTDTLAQYTQYADVNASWGVVSGQMTATGGGASQAVLTRNGVSFADGSVSCNMNYASDAGLVLRLQDNNNYYVATINDGGSMTSPQNTVRIYKRVGGAFTQLGTDVTISFSRNTNHDFKFTASGTSLEVHFDGVSILSVTDSSLSAAGKAGMRHNGAADPNGSKFNSFSWPSS